MKMIMRLFGVSFRRKTIKDVFIKVLIFIFSILAIVALTMMFAFLIKEAYPAYQKYGFWHMYFSASFNEEGKWGIWSPLLITLFTSFLAILIATPIALRSAYFIRFRIKRGKKFLRTLINILAGVPSVIFGIFAIKSLQSLTNIFISTTHGNTILNGTFMLVIIVLPTMISLILNQLFLLPDDLINSSLALGNTKIFVSYTTVKKSIKKGVYVAIIVALGRAIGETMALSIILITNSNNPFAQGLWEFLQSDFGTLGVLIAKNMITDQGRDPSALFAAGLSLFLIIMILVMIVTKISNKKRIVNQNPLNEKPWTSFNQIEEIFLIFLIKFWYYFWLPFKLLNFGLFWLFSKLNQFFHFVIYLLVWPFLRFLNLIKHDYESYSQYFTRYTRTKGSHIGDYWRISWEIICITFVVGIVLWIIFDICVLGMSQYRLEDWQFFNLKAIGNNHKALPSVLLHPLIWTLVLIGFTIVIVFPFALATAIFLSEYARDKPIGKVVKFFLDSLGGTPSILFGLFGSIFFIKTLNLRGIVPFSLIAGTLTMTLVILPTFTRSIEQVLIKIPDSYRYGSYAVGASKSTTIFKIIIPQSLSGVISGTIISMGRIMGETAPIFLTLGLTTVLVDIGLFLPGHTLTTNILDVFANNRDALSFEDQIKLSYKIGSVALIATTLIILFAQSIPYLSQKIKNIFLNRKKRKRLSKIKMEISND